MVLLAVNMVILPLNIAFFYEESLLSWMIFHSISDVLFIVDIVLNFRTGYQEDKNGYRLKFILDPKLIAQRYAFCYSFNVTINIRLEREETIYFCEVLCVY